MKDLMMRLKGIRMRALVCEGDTNLIYPLDGTEHCTDNTLSIIHKRFMVIKWPLLAEMEAVKKLSVLLKIPSMPRHCAMN